MCVFALKLLTSFCARHVLICVGSLIIIFSVLARFITDFVLLLVLLAVKFTQFGTIFQGNLIAVYSRLIAFVQHLQYMYGCLFHLIKHQTKVSQSTGGSHNVGNDE